uniref:Peptidase A1 domain-containing protein n=1 Tax=Oryza brachyantha TaxID=4533 RepID=J3M6P8_ORYBR
MADRIPSVAAAIAIASLLLILTPEIVSSGLIPRFKLSPKANKQIRDIFKDHATEFAGLAADAIPSGGDGSESSPSQAPAPTAGTYLITVGVGTPPQYVSGAFDVTSELVWVPCEVCPATRPPASDKAGVFRTLPGGLYACGSSACRGTLQQRCPSGGDSACTYTCRYGGAGGLVTSGNLGAQVFTLGDSTIENLKFGCGLEPAANYGVIGLNRWRLSLVTQLRLTRFSYYFAPEDDDDGAGGNGSFILFGEYAVPRTSDPRHTQFFRYNDGAYGNLYLVGLSGVRVGGNVVSSTRTSSGSGSGGAPLVAYLSTSVPVTILEKGTYELVKREVMSAVGPETVDGASALGLDLCYRSQYLASVELPAMALVFWDGAVMELQPRNYLYQDMATGLECLTILPSSQDAGGLTLLGNLIQTGTHMIYDIERSRLVFESLDQPSKRPSSSSTA